MKEKSRNLIVRGAGGHAMVVAEAAALQQSPSRIVFMAPELSPIRFPSEVDCMFVTAEIPDTTFDRNEWAFVSAIGDCHARAKVHAELLDAGFSPASIVHPGAIVSESATIGAGSVALSGSTIQAGCWLGEGVIINNNASIDHDCRIGSFTHICPGATLAGNVTVGEKSMVGTGASVVPGRSLGAGCVLGAGAVLVDVDCPDGAVFVGIPARNLESREQI